MWFFKPIWKLNIIDIIKVIFLISFLGLIFLGPLALQEPSARDKVALSKAIYQLQIHEAYNGSCIIADSVIEYVMNKSKGSPLTLLDIRITIASIDSCF